MLCKEQHVSHNWSHESNFENLNPYFKIVSLFFMIPNVHSTFFLMLSNHSANLMNLYVVKWLKGGIVQDQDMYPLSQINHPPLYSTSTTFPLLSNSNNLKILFPNNFPFRTPTWKSSDIINDLSFHVAGFPLVESTQNNSCLYIEWRNTELPPLIWQRAPASLCVDQKLDLVFLCQNL